MLLRLEIELGYGYMTNMGMLKSFLSFSMFWRGLWRVIRMPWCMLEIGVKCKYLKKNESNIAEDDKPKN